MEGRGLRFKEEDCEYVLGGDCDDWLVTEHETYKHIPTGKLILVPVDIVRHWDYAKEQDE